MWVHQLTSHDSRRVGHSSCLSLGTRARIDASVRDVARGAGVDASREDDSVKRAFVRARRRRRYRPRRRTERG